MTVEQEAAVDDGNLDFYSLEIAHWWRLLALLPALRRGTHGKAADVRAFKTQEIRLTTRKPRPINTDGELTTHTRPTQGHAEDPADLRPTRLPAELTFVNDLMQLAADPAAWAALATLVVMEVVLGIDNLIFISILTNKLPPENQASARRIGIGLALGLRLALLGLVAFIVHLTEPVFSILGHAFSWRDIILIAGGLFLLWKATKEIHHTVDPDPVEEGGKGGSIGFAAAIGQILLLDLVFSIDSIITAVGMTEHVPIMMIAVVAAVTVMLVAANPLSAFIARNRPW